MPLVVHINSMTRWQAHREKWQNCTLCPLGKRAGNHVLVRGRIPADVIFIGEAPGEAEDGCGEPFVGRAGGVLDALLIDLRKSLPTFTFAIGNILACIPRPDKEYNDNMSKSFRKPRKHEIEACTPRLIELAELINPRVVIHLGETANKNAPFPPENSDIPWIKVRHPSYILRNGGKGSVEYKRCLLQLIKFLKPELV